MPDECSSRQHRTFGDGADDNQEHLMLPQWVRRTCQAAAPHFWGSGRRRSKSLAMAALVLALVVLPSTVAEITPPSAALAEFDDAIRDRMVVFKDYSRNDALFGSLSHAQHNALDSRFGGVAPMLRSLSASYVESRYVTVGVSLSLTGKYAMPLKHQRAVKAALETWKTSYDGKELGGFEIQVDYIILDDRSSLKIMCENYMYLASLSHFSYDLANTNLTSPISHLLGPSVPEFARAAVKIAEVAGMAIIMWSSDTLTAAADDTIYGTTPQAYLTSWIESGLPKTNTIQVNSTVQRFLTSKSLPACPVDIAALASEITSLSSTLWLTPPPFNPCALPCPGNLGLISCSPPLRSNIDDETNKFCSAFVSILARINQTTTPLLEVATVIQILTEEYDRFVLSPGCMQGSSNNAPLANLDNANLTAVSKELENLMGSSFTALSQELSTWNGSVALNSSTQRGLFHRLIQSVFGGLSSFAYLASKAVTTTVRRPSPSVPWDIGYRNAFDVIQPLEFVLQDALEQVSRSSTSRSDTKVWFVADPSDEEQRNACAYGAKLARNDLTLNYTSVLLVEIESWRPFILNMMMGVARRPPEALVICGDATYFSQLMAYCKANVASPPMQPISTVFQVNGGFQKGSEPRMLTFSIQSLPWPSAISQKSFLADTSQIYFLAATYDDINEKYNAQYSLLYGDTGAELPELSALQMLSATRLALLCLLNISTSPEIATGDRFTDLVCNSKPTQTHLGPLSFDCGRTSGANPFGSRIGGSGSSSRLLLPLDNANSELFASSGGYGSCSSAIVPLSNVLPRRLMWMIEARVLASECPGPDHVSGELGVVAGYNISDPDLYAVLQDNRAFDDKVDDERYCALGCGFYRQEGLCGFCPPGKAGTAFGDGCDVCSKMSVGTTGEFIDTYTDSWGLAVCTVVPDTAIFSEVYLTPYAREGYYRVVDREASGTDEVFLICNDTNQPVQLKVFFLKCEFCLENNTCQSEAQGTLCASCAVDFENRGFMALVSGGVCQQCPPGDTRIVVWVVAILVVLISFQIFKRGFDRPNEVRSLLGPMVRQFMLYLQMIAIVSSPKDRVLMSDGGYLGLVLLRPLDITFLSCYFPFPADDTDLTGIADVVLRQGECYFYFFLSGISFICLLSLTPRFLRLFCLAIKYYLMRATSLFVQSDTEVHEYTEYLWDTSHWCRSFVVNSIRVTQLTLLDCCSDVILWLMLTYPTVLWGFIEILRCNAQADEAPRLVRNPEVRCDDEVYSYYIEVGAYRSILWALFSPLLIFLISWYFKQDFHTLFARRIISPVIFGVRQECFWWVAKSELLVGLLVFCGIDKSTYFRFIYQLLVMVLSLLGFTVFSPFVPMERSSLWHLEVNVHISVILRIIAVYMQALHGWEESRATYALGLLQVIVHARTLTTILWFATMSNFILPTIAVKGRAKQWILRWLLGHMRGMNPVFLGWHNGTRYLDLSCLSAGERRFLAGAMQHTIGLIYKSSDIYCVHFVEHFLSDAFNRALSASRERAERKMGFYLSRRCLRGLSLFKFEKERQRESFVLEYSPNFKETLMAKVQKIGGYQLGTLGEDLLHGVRVVDRMGLDALDLVLESLHAKERFPLTVSLRKTYLVSAEDLVTALHIVEDDIIASHPDLKSQSTMLSKQPPAQTHGQDSVAEQEPISRDFVGKRDQFNVMLPRSEIHQFQGESGLLTLPDASTLIDRIKSHLRIQMSSREWSSFETKDFLVIQRKIHQQYVKNKDTWNQEMRKLGPAFASACGHKRELQRLAMMRQQLKLRTHYCHALQKQLNQAEALQDAAIANATTSTRNRRPDSGDDAGSHSSRSSGINWGDLFEARQKPRAREEQVVDALEGSVPAIDGGHTTTFDAAAVSLAAVMGLAQTSKEKRPQLAGRSEAPFMETSFADTKGTDGQESCVLSPKSAYNDDIQPQRSDARSGNCRQQ